MPRYCGRFAPSPTGPLHFGSLVAAAASYLDARAQGGSWLVRMEDLDTDREQPGAASAILAGLERFGFEWDGEVLYQSRRTEIYRAALARLQAAGCVYPCACSRKEIADSALRSGRQDAQRYPGTCAQGIPAGRSPRSWRVRTDGQGIAFDDRLQGAQQMNLREETGDFVVFRADGLFAYHLAVVMDDAAQQVTDIVRGADLLDSTPRQIHLQRLLGLPEPRYLHIPAAVDAQGNKLSKQTRAPALDHERAGPLLCAALRFLGHEPPAGLHSAAPGEVWLWAVGNWSVDRVPRVASRIAPEGID